VTARSPAPGGPPASAGDDAERWREAARLRRDHPRWAIVWLALDREFHAYRRLPGARRDTALASPTATGLADLITQAERAAAATPVGTKETSR
jgi:hypothetical protein